MKKKKYGRFTFGKFEACDVSRIKLYNCFPREKDEVKFIFSVRYNF